MRPMDDLDLLRSFEPVVRFTQGEYFFPVSVEPYVARAALWSDTQGDEAVLVAAPDGFGLATLPSQVRATQGLGQSLSGIRTAEGDSGRSHIPTRERPPRLKGASRLAAVGLLARLVDALNRLSLVFRGSLPGGSAGRSFLLQRDHLHPERPTYHGRVLRHGDWIICQYWYFYCFNNWRSAFGGVNEHEADWEQVTVYLDGTGEVDDAGRPLPRWVVFSAHDETGDDLRRRWDDPDLSLVDGRHPVVFAGAGSHSGAYLAGDYLITIATPERNVLLKVVRGLARIFTPWSSSAQGVGIPYVDYARGDGRSIGPGQLEGWTPVVIDESTPWVRDYRGLWGTDTRDRLGGERGPAGPRYERDGTVRQSWADPVSWAGLAKVAPNPRAERALVEARAAKVDERLADLEAQVQQLGHDLATAAAGLAPAAPEVRALAQEEARLLQLRMEQTRLRDERARMLSDAAPASGVAGPHAHLRHRRTPLERRPGFRGRLLSWWAVLSTPFILYALAVIVSPTLGVSATATALAWLVILMSIEGLVRGQFLRVMGRFLLVLLAFVALVLVWLDWRWVLYTVLMVAALVVLVANVREALRR
jgi:hypothetical protein